MSSTITTTPATYTVPQACRRLGIGVAAFRRGWAGVFSPVESGARAWVLLLRDEVEHAAQFAGDRDRMIRAVLAYRRDVKGRRV